MDNEVDNQIEKPHLTKYLSPISVWALSFGCAVGWGAFVMPGTTFLPAAGPLGTALGIGIGAVVMLIIGMNYHFLMNKYPDAGGTMTYATKAFGYDNGFLSSWFLMLVYFAIIWANASALPLIARNLLGGAFQFGFHYSILGYDVYLGEVLLSIAAIMLCGLLCIYGKRAAVRIQTVLAIALIAGVAICAFAVRRYSGSAVRIDPAFSPTGGNPAGQVAAIIALSPWAFVGFESVSQSTAGFRFSAKKSIWIMDAALVTGALAYILLSLIAASVLPAGYQSWPDYLADLGNLQGMQGLPTFYAIQSAMGTLGLAILGVAVAAAILTGLVGNYIAASRLMFTMAGNGILPQWFGRLGPDNTPKNALRFLMALSVFIAGGLTGELSWRTLREFMDAVRYHLPRVSAGVWAHSILGTLGGAVFIMLLFYAIATISQNFRKHKFLYYVMLLVIAVILLRLLSLINGAGYDVPNEQQRRHHRRRGRADGDLRHRKRPLGGTDRAVSLRRRAVLSDVGVPQIPTQPRIIDRSRPLAALAFVVRICDNSLTQAKHTFEKRSTLWNSNMIRPRAAFR